MIDTNIFISAALFPNGKVAQALRKALTYPYQPITCDYVVDELHKKFQEKISRQISGTRGVFICRITVNKGCQSEKLLLRFILRTALYFKLQFEKQNLFEVAIDSISRIFKVNKARK